MLYSRFWNKFLKDLGKVPEEEFAKKLVNQGMIQGRSNFVYRVLIAIGNYELFEVDNVPTSERSPIIFISKNLKDILEKGLKSDLDIINDWTKQIQQAVDKKIAKHKVNYPHRNWDITWFRNVFTELHVDVNIVENDVLDIEAFKASRNDVPADVQFILEEGKYICGWEIEKMSKSKFNVVNPDLIVEKYGADTLRLYEMFLGPLTDFKPWNTNGITGTFGFLRKFWRLFFNDEVASPSYGKLLITDEPPTPEELKALHKAIKKVGEDIEALSFNTSIPAFMVLCNELTGLKCHKRAILSNFVLILAPFAPHICEELWAALGNQPGTVTQQDFPKLNKAYLIESVFEYPVQINGKVRTTLTFPLDTVASEIEKEVLANEIVQKWLDGKAPKKIVVVPNRIVNVVV